MPQPGQQMLVLAGQQRAFPPSVNPIEIIAADGKTVLYAVDADGTVVQQGGVPTPGSPLRLIDLGVVNAVDLLNAPQTLYTSRAGQYVQLVVAADDYIPWDAQTVAIAFAGAVSTSSFAEFQGLFSPNTAFWFGLIGACDPGTVPGVDALTAYLAVGTFHPVAAPLEAWQANHIYAAFASILGPDDHIWLSSGGTSGGLIPDFAGNEGGTVVDNDITWTDEGAIPTQGTLHLYALVS